MGTYERKTREIQKSLHRRARMRRAYFKMIGEDPKKRTRETEAIDNGKEISLSGSDSEHEGSSDVKKVEDEEPRKKKLTGREMARKKRAEKYHQQKEKEEAVKAAQDRRVQNKNIMKKRTSKGQPRLGSQVGVLLDKIKKSSGP